MRGAGIDLEVEIYSTKLAHEHKCMKLKGELARTVPTASVIHGVKPRLSALKPNSKQPTKNNIDFRGHQAEDLVPRRHSLCK
jgi:hypothetical protein